MSLVLLIFLHIERFEPPVVDRVSLIELNHFYSPEAEPVFSQLLFWQFNPHRGRYDLIDWKLSKGKEHVIKDYRTGRYVLRMWDGDTYREIWAEQYKESYTQHDPELLAREITPVQDRKKLSLPRRYERTPESKLTRP